jgi:hypothetical protein
MLNTIKNFFFGSSDEGFGGYIQQTEQVPDGITTETTSFGYVMSATTGGFALVSREGELIQTYSRRRDALRGAARRGLVVA